MTQAGVRAWGLGVGLPALLLVSCIQPKPLDILGEIPEFSLTSETGQPFDGNSLTGHIWVADFIYTTCEGPCPRMSSLMHQLQTLTAEMPDVKLVSFTVDPAHDTPPVLAAYATHFKPDPARWSFLTGEQASLNDLALHGFKLNSVDGSMSHSTRFALVDQKRRIRAYYISSEDGMLPHLLHDIRQLERYPS
ncbi:MAG TPA: SCO family protein [Bryobacteraceae bacterium]|nr:SCO family protein [Bryobacteraceae bacterium]